MSEQIKVELQGSFGDDRSIAEAAWTSSLTLQGKERRSDEDVARIVARLANDGHAVPFESVVLRFWIKMPIQTDRQYITHRNASNSGMSGRYRTMPDEFLRPSQDIWAILDKTAVLSELNNVYAEEVVRQYMEICVNANAWYRQMLQEFRKEETDGRITNAEYKRLREFFRGVLPQNNMTERVSIMNLRSFANFIRLRNSEHAQPEIRQVAQMMLEQVKAKGICPVALEGLEKRAWTI